MSGGTISSGNTFLGQVERFRAHAWADILVNQLTRRVDFSGINIFSHSFVVRHRCKKPFSSHIIIHIVSTQFNSYCDSQQMSFWHVSSPQPPQKIGLHV
jgi:hypothetical protein